MLQKHGTVWKMAMPRIANFAVLCHSPMAAHASAVHHSAKRLSERVLTKDVSKQTWVFFFRVLNPWIISTRRQDTLKTAPVVLEGASATSQKSPQPQRSSAASTGTCSRPLAPAWSFPRHQRSCVLSGHSWGLRKQRHNIGGDEKRDGFVCAIRIRCCGCQAAGAWKASAASPPRSGLNGALSNLQLKKLRHKKKPTNKQKLIRK